MHFRIALIFNILPYAENGSNYLEKLRMCMRCCRKRTRRLGYWSNTKFSRERCSRNKMRVISLPSKGTLNLQDLGEWLLVILSVSRPVSSIPQMPDTQKYLSWARALIETAEEADIPFHLIAVITLSVKGLSSADASCMHRTLCSILQPYSIEYRIWAFPWPGINIASVGWIKGHLLFERVS